VVVHRIGPNSHFFTVDDYECTVVKTNLYWLYEGVAFRALPPSGGVCAAGRTPVVRFFWSGTEVALLRHRYVVDPAEAARMRAAGARRRDCFLRAAIASTTGWR